MNPISQTPEDLAFGREDLRSGCQEGIYEEVTTGEAERIRSTGAMISPSFVVWQDGPEGRKGRFVVNLSKQFKHWPKGSVRMETLPEYALEVERGEKMVSFDIQAGYRHFRLAPQMRDWLLFRYEGRFYRCIALPFGWGRSPIWFTQLMVPMVRKLTEQYRVLAYLDDFLICPIKAGRVASMRDCRKATQVIDKLLSSLGLTRHPTNGEWVGSTRMEHLGCVIDSDRMRFYIAPRTIAMVHGIARAILRQARQGRR
jgi:Reverse transcriptase (RNA-dependent DNA polymerase)